MSTTKLSAEEIRAIYGRVVSMQGSFTGIFSQIKNFGAIDVGLEAGQEAGLPIGYFTQIPIGGGAQWETMRDSLGEQVTKQKVADLLRSVFNSFIGAKGVANLDAESFGSDTISSLDDATPFDIAVIMMRMLFDHGSSGSDQAGWLAALSKNRSQALATFNLTVGLFQTEIAPTIKEYRNTLSGSFATLGSKNGPRLKASDYFRDVPDAVNSAFYEMSGWGDYHVKSLSFLWLNFTKHIGEGMFGKSGTAGAWSLEALSFYLEVLQFQYNTGAFVPGHELTFCDKTYNDYVEVFTAIAAEFGEEQKESAGVTVKANEANLKIFIAALSTEPLISIPPIQLLTIGAVNKMKTKHVYATKGGNCANFMTKLYQSAGVFSKFVLSSQERQQTCTYTDIWGQSITVAQSAKVAMHNVAVYLSIHRIDTRILISRLYPDGSYVPTARAIFGVLPQFPPLSVMDSLKLRVGIAQPISGTAQANRTNIGVEYMLSIGTFGGLLGVTGCADEVFPFVRQHAAFSANRFVFSTQANYLFGAAPISVGNGPPVIALSFLAGYPFNQSSREMFKSLSSAYSQLASLSAAVLYKNLGSFDNDWTIQAAQNLKNKQLVKFFTSAETEVQFDSTELAMFMGKGATGFSVASSALDGRFNFMMSAGISKEEVMLAIKGTKNEDGLTKFRKDVQASVSAKDDEKKEENR